MSGRRSPDNAVSGLEREAALIAADAGRMLGPLVDRSSVSGDATGFEACVELVLAELPAIAVVERPACSTPTCPPDLLARVTGTGAGRLVLLGHLDTVVPLDRHQPLRHEGDRWAGSGTFDMKGGDAIAVGLLRSLARRPEAFAELALLLVADEEWRSAPFAHGPRFEGWDACLCFEGGERTTAGDEAVVVRRKAAASIVVTARGRAAHAGSKPHEGRNALLALARVATAIAEQHAPDGPDHLSAVPTILQSGDALNVVPDSGTLTCDLRAKDVAALQRVLDGLPRELDGVELEPTFGRVWPGMDHRAVAAPVLARASGTLGRPIAPASRGGASDASHLAPWVSVAIDGLGPLGGGAHADDEHIDGGTLVDRAAVALAVADAVLGAA